MLRHVLEWPRSNGRRTLDLWAASHRTTSGRHSTSQAEQKRSVGQRENIPAPDRRRRNERAVLVSEQLQNSLCLLIERLHRTEHRCLFVECLASPRDECRWNAKCRTISNSRSDLATLGDERIGERSGARGGSWWSRLGGLRKDAPSIQIRSVGSASGCDPIRNGDS